VAGFAVGSYADSGRTFVDTALVDRVELLRGPASSLYGSDAFGGIVAFATLSPASLLRDPAQGTALRTEAGYAGADAAWHGVLVAAGDAGEAGRWLAGYAYRSGRELATVADVEPDVRDYTSDSIMLKYESPALAGAPVRLTFETGHIVQQADVTAFLGLARSVRKHHLAARGRLERTFSSEPGAGADRPRHLDRCRRLEALLAIDADTAGYPGNAQGRAATHAGRATRPRLRVERSFLWLRVYGHERRARRSLWHGLVYGAELARSRLEELRAGLQTTIATDITTPVILGETFPLRDLPLTDVTRIGVFIQDEISRNDERWSLVPALRVDYYDLAPRADAIYSADNPATKPVGLDELSFAPKFGATWRATQATTVFFQYAHGFRSPPPEDVNVGLEIPLFNVRAIPNPDLQPETSDGFEIGLRVATPGIKFTASLYQNEYRDFIESKINLGVDATTGVILFQSRNVARARIQGAELTTAVDGAVLAPTLEGWTARLAAAFARGEDLERDKPLNSIDPPDLVLGLRYQSTAARWGVEMVTTAGAAQRS
jgi:hemoglobin/transferrin/lactoferrin receptor protein